MEDVAFIAVDWGTSSFRLWALGVHGTIVASSSGPFGMANLKRSDFSSVLEDSIARIGLGASVPVVICGMAGAAQGWCEAPYLQTPTPLHALGNGAVSVRGSTRNVRILPGIKQLSPANVMRGEETQISGLLHHHPDFSGTVCLPGTHTKWVRVADKSILDFETCMTGEQFAFFSEASVLSHSMIVEGWSDTAFANAVAVALDDPTS
ncbi:MAG: 2-dehydro-3-deoxygalactonokinase, partial [Marinosulfonomonas sp.]